MSFRTRDMPQESRFLGVLFFSLTLFLSIVLARDAMGAIQDGALVEFPSDQVTIVTDPSAGAPAFSMPYLSQQPALRTITSNLYAQPGGIASSVPSFGLPSLSVSSALTFTFTKGPGIVVLEAGTPTQQQTASNVVQGFGT